MYDDENDISRDRNIIIINDKQLEITSYPKDEIEYVKRNFCGQAYLSPETFSRGIFSPDIPIYMTGDIRKNYSVIPDPVGLVIYVVRELSYGYDSSFRLIDIGRVPINIFNIGVYFRNFFDQKKNYFDLISKEHEFQTLMESSKEINHVKKGVHITKVEELNPGELKFRIIRNTTNLIGPTENLRKVDNEIIDSLNNMGKIFFERQFELNHSYAQLIDNEHEQKAKREFQSDPTKDIPRNGVFAICTFYKDDPKFKNLLKSRADPYFYNYNHNKTTAFAKIRFKLKPMVEEISFMQEFDVVLYPNSVMAFSLDTNRIYTYEIIPSSLPPEQVPTRISYLVRCAKTTAIYKENERQTYIKETNSYKKLEKSSGIQSREFKDMFYMETNYDNLIKYPRIPYSLNRGDYMKPTY